MSDLDDSSCPVCGEDGGTSCGAQNCGLLVGEDEGPSYEDRLQEVAMLVSQAIGLIDDIASQDRVLYAPTYRNVLEHGHKGLRRKTLGDAKREARQVATLLRRAWEIADPTSEEQMLAALGPCGK